MEQWSEGEDGVSGEDVAAQLIETARRSGARILDLSDLDLSEVPESVRYLDRLEVLILNRTSSLDRWDPDSRQVPWFSENNIAELPHWIGDLPRLTSIATGELNSYDSLYALKNLTYLSIRRSRREIPSDLLRALTSLTELDVSYGSWFQELDWLRACPRLRAFWADGCAQLRSLEGLREVPQLRRLHVPHCPVLSSLDGIQSVRELIVLRADRCEAAEQQWGPFALHRRGINPCERLHGFELLRTQPKLQTLGLSGCLGLEDLTVLGGHAVLETLDLGTCMNLGSIAPLSSLLRLRDLNLSGVPAVADLRPLAPLRKLEKLRIQCVAQLETLEGLQEHEQLHTLVARECTALVNLDGLTGCKGLAEVDLSGCRSLNSVEGLRGLEKLKVLGLHGCASLKSINSLGFAAKLEKLDLTNCTSLQSLEGLELASDLAHIDLRRCEALRSLRGLPLAAACTGFDASGCQKLEEVDAIAGWSQLARVELAGCTGLKSIAGLADLPRLATLSLAKCSQLRDVDALREATALRHLDLTRCTGLSSIDGLSGLPALHTLELSHAAGLQDFRPISTLAALTSLNVANSPSLTNVEFLRPLRHLTSLKLQRCRCIIDLSALRSLPALRFLDLWGCSEITSFPRFLLYLPSLENLIVNASGVRDVPKELLGEYSGSNALPGLRAHFDALADGARLHREIKLIVLGNARVGKTSLCRRLVEGRFDPQEPSTHGVKFWTWMLDDPQLRDEPITVNVWDFGGQDIYYGTHTMFHRGRAVFVLAWNPQAEAVEEYVDDTTGLTHRHYPLQYWIDYVRHISPGSAIILVQTQCAGDAARVATSVAPAAPHGTPIETWLHASAGEDHASNRAGLADCILDAARKSLGSREAQTIGRARFGVLEEVRRLRPTGEARVMTRDEFSRLCRRHELHGTNGIEELLLYLHACGSLYYQPEPFGDMVIIDQRWACDAIYTVLDRDAAVQRIARSGGVFGADDLAKWCWADRSQEERKLFLQLMVRCGICFVYKKGDESERRYLAPDLAPPRSTAQGRFVQPAPGEILSWRYEFSFLSQSVIRAAMCEVGSRSSESAIYWKDGFYFPPGDFEAAGVVEAEYRSHGSPSRGRITLQAWGPSREELLTHFRELFEGPSGRWEDGLRRPRGARVFRSIDGGPFGEVGSGPDRVEIS